MFDGVYEGKRVLVTGSTGFKGVYLSFFLQKLKAEVLGIALPMPELSLYNICRGDKYLSTSFCDIRDKEKLEKSLKTRGELARTFDFRPLFHMDCSDKETVQLPNRVVLWYFLDSRKYRPSL